MAIINNNLINHNIFNNSNITKNKENDYNQNNNKITKNFKDILDDVADDSVMFSKHATMRLNSRNLSLSTNQIKRIEDGIKKAEEKGIKDSLVLVDDIALLVNIKNRVVITAIDNNSEKVYTNIDGAVIV